MRHVLSAADEVKNSFSQSYALQFVVNHNVLFVNSTEEVQVNVTLDGKEYVKAYGDKNSLEYKNLAKEFCGKVGLIN